MEKEELDTIIREVFRDYLAANPIKRRSTVLHTNAFGVDMFNEAMETEAMGTGRVYVSKIPRIVKKKLHTSGYTGRKFVRYKKGM